MSVAKVPPANNASMSEMRHAAYLRHNRLCLLAAEYGLRSLIPDAKPLQPQVEIEAASREGAEALLERKPELDARIEAIDETWVR